MFGPKISVLLTSPFDAGLPRGKKPRIDYIGRLNRNGTEVTRASHDRLAPDYADAVLRRRSRRAERWLAANPGKGLHAAPRHIRENAP